jgi:hypothetical protein
MLDTDYWCDREARRCCGYLAYGLQHGARANRLLKHLSRTELRHRHRSRHINECAQNQERGSLGGLTQCASDFESRHVWQAQIQHDKVDPLRLCQG